MSRPIHADAKATRRRIVDSAHRLFARHGLAGASVRRIAGDAGVSLALVHHYFGSKDGLYEACVSSMYEELAALRARLGAALAGGPGPATPAVAIAAAVRAGFRLAREHQLAMRLLLRSVMEAGELLAEYRDRHQLPFLAEASTTLGAALGRPARELRLPLQSIVFLASRYAVSTDRELATLTGVTDGAEAAARAAEDHLVAVACALLLPTPPSCEGDVAS
jgi:AcrR family transcriptional regulator